MGIALWKGAPLLSLAFGEGYDFFGITRCVVYYFVMGRPSRTSARYMRLGQAGVALLALMLPSAAYGLEITGWIPYWRSEAGVQSILPNLGSLTEVNPFIYTVKIDGRLNEASSLSAPEWQTLRAAAKEKSVKFIPTVTWANPDAIDNVLRDSTKRQAHIQGIAQAVFGNNLDGVDIDYEGKYARTRPYFSLFLKELTEAIGYDKWVMCTIESRTPLDSRFAKPEDIPKDIEYANDFSEINKWCDRIRIMAYDQGRFDLKLNAANAHPYAPVADKVWVEKVMTLAAQEIDKEKLLIGVPTYGYEYDMFTASDGTTDYSRLWSFNPGYATELAQKLGLTPSRGPYGEMLLIYPASKAPDGVVPLPNATRILSWSDADSIREKAELAKRLGLRGISLFKLDGGQDHEIAAVIVAHAEDAPIAKRSSLPASSHGGGSSSVVVPSRDLERGMRVEDVRALQRFLNAKGFTVASSGGGSSGQETIFFGPATQNALIHFQKAHGLKPSVGYYGPLTRAKFRSLL